jgi:hypothetical protein
MPTQPKAYVCPRTIVTPRLDGGLDESVWGHAPWIAPFVDIEGDLRPEPSFETRMRMLWDGDALYIGAQLEEPHVWGTIMEHDAVIYQDNDFEVFLDPSGRGHHYVELEVNPLNTTWDLLLTHPYRAGGMPISGWEFEGLRTAVHVEGTLNDPADMDTGWSVEIAIPWKSLRDVSGVECPPRNGDQWRINFSRVEWRHEIVDGTYRKTPNLPEFNWVWSPQYAIDMHRPEWWGIVQFSDRTADLPESRPLAEWQNRLELLEVWEAEQRVLAETGRYTADARTLGIDRADLDLEATSSMFEARLGNCRLDHELRWSLA